VGGAVPGASAARLSPVPAVRRRLAAAVLAALLGVPAVTACTGSEDEPETAPTPRATSLAELAEEDPTVVRAGFCPRVAPQAVGDALGASVEDSTTWSNGDRGEVAGGGSDVLHEFGCSWTAEDGTVARAWVFAPPVDTAEARRLAKQARNAEGCRPVARAAAFGAPSATVGCTEQGRATTAYHGLFGDAWLSCTIEAAEEPDPARTDRWCAAVVQAAAA
jgi:hypothetical protein